MKRITLGALDYAVAFGVDRALRSLLLEGRLSAVGCLVASELWAREFKPMQEVAEKVGQRALIGVTLAFSGDRVHPVSERMRELYREKMPSRSFVQRRAMLRLLPDEVFAAEADAQLTRFTFLMNREPDFVAVREGLMERSVIARHVFDAIERAGFERTPKIISPFEPGLHAKRLDRIAAKKGIEVLPKGPPLPETSDSEDLHRKLRHHFDGLRDMTFVPCIPAQVDDRLRREEPREKVTMRECQWKVLRSDRFFHTLEEADVFLN